MEKEYKYLVCSLENIVYATEEITSWNISHKIGELQCYTNRSQHYLHELKQIEANWSNINLDRVDTLLNLISILNRDPLNSLWSIKIYAQECLKTLLSE